MQNALTQKGFNCISDHAIETINYINLDRLTNLFDNLPSDPYLKAKYRFRALSRFRVIDDKLVKLPHDLFFQSEKYNPLLGNVIREYPEIEDELIQLEDFQTIVGEFYEFCKLCSSHKDIAVHQIRTLASAEQIAQPAPEGIHRDGVDLLGIFCVNRDQIEGGITSLYKAKNESPIVSKILNPGEFLVFNDNQFFHYTSAITAKDSQSGIRDVFVLTCPGLLPPARTPLD